MQKIVKDTIGLIKKTNIKWRESNGKLIISARHTKDNKSVSGMNSWRFFKHDNNVMKCLLWKSVTLDFLCKHFLDKGRRFIPLGCLDCYKVVVKPRTYSQLIELEHRMESQKSGTYCKCGIETRGYVKGLYGGYFYNRGIDAGLKKLAEVQEMIFWDVPVYLKRGCTEIELEFGPSNKWEIKEHQIEIEKDVAEHIGVDEADTHLTDEDIEKTHALWKSFAWKYDISYDGPELCPKAVTY